MARLILEDDEKSRFDNWKRSHYATCQLQPGTVGDLYHFNICPSGIGTFISVHCPCGASEDITGEL